MKILRIVSMAAALSVALNVNFLPAQTVEFQPVVTDLAGDPVSAVLVGEEVLLLVFVQDVRDDAQGVFSAYVDVEYDPGVVSFVPRSLTHGDQFGIAPRGDPSVAGVIDDTGSIVQPDFDDNTPPPIGPQLGPEAVLLFSANFRAETQGMALYSTNPPENLPRLSTTVHGLDDAVPFDQILFGTASLKVVPEPSTGWLLAIGLPWLWSQFSRRPNQRRPPT